MTDTLTATHTRATGLLARLRPLPPDAALITGGALLALIAGIVVTLVPHTISIIVLLGGAFLFLLRVAGVSAASATLITAFMAEQFTADFDIGPFSLRIYLLSGTFLLVMLQSAIAHEPVFRTKAAMHFAIAYGLLITWMLIGDLGRGAHPADALPEILAGPMLALLLFVSAQHLLRDAKALRWMIGVFVASATVNAIFAFLQWMDVSFAWRATEILHSSERARSIARGLIGGHGIVTHDEGAGWVAGLTLYNVTLNAQLLSFGFIGVFWAAYRRRAGIAVRALAIATGLVSLLAVFLSQERSGIFGVPMALAILAFAQMIWRTSQRQRLRKRRGPTLAAVAGLIIGLVALFSFAGSRGGESATAGEGGYRLDRFTHSPLTSRLGIVDVAWGVAIRNPLYGSPAEWRTEAATRLDFHSSPHNYFVSAATLHGMPALLLATLTLIAGFRIARDALRRRVDDLRNWTSVALAFGFIGFVLNSMAHSASFLIGDTLPIWLLAGMICIASLPPSDREAGPEGSAT